MHVGAGLKNCHNIWRQLVLVFLQKSDHRVGHRARIVQHPKTEAAGVALGALVALVLPLMVFPQLAQEGVVSSPRQNHFFVEQRQNPGGLLVDQVQHVLI